MKTFCFYIETNWTGKIFLTIKILASVRYIHQPEVRNQMQMSKNPNRKWPILMAFLSNVFATQWTFVFVLFNVPVTTFLQHFDMNKWAVKNFYHKTLPTTFCWYQLCDLSPDFFTTKSCLKRGSFGFSRTMQLTDECWGKWCVLH